MRGDHCDRFRDHRIDLTRHDTAARLQSRQRNLAEAGQRTAVHPSQIVDDLHQADRKHPKLAGQLHRGILASKPLKVIIRDPKLKPGLFA